ncbi:MAG: glucose 1-dehydrogenase [Phycisphaerales bacterium]|nr:glucose 1-dehydrogenase [Phycisphaerales bacterium]
MPHTSLANQTAIVTGSARGIGAAIATRLAADGAKVVVNFSTSAKPAGDTVSAITKAGGKAVAVQADISDAAGVTKLFDAAEKAFGPVSILVNNAAAYEMRPLEKCDHDHFEKTMHTNVLGTLLVTAEFSRRFKADAGRVVNISSGAARAAIPECGVYCASKAAVEALARVHALELAKRHITVNCVAPGTTETEMLKGGLNDDMRKFMIDHTTLGRLGQPDDIADVVAFLCSNDARWITGQFIDASGGLRI